MRISDWSSDVCSSDLMGQVSRVRGATTDQCLDTRDQLGKGKGLAEVVISALSQPPYPIIHRPPGRQHDDRGFLLLAQALEYAIDWTCVVSDKSVSVRLVLGGRRFIKKKKYNHK